MKWPNSRKLTQHGFHHMFIMAAAFIVLFGAIGTYFLLISNAATTTDEISNGNGTCIEDPGNQGQGNTNLVAKPCNQSYRQIFEQDGSGGDTAWHTYKLYYNSSGPLCLSSQGNHTTPGTHLQANKCGTNDANALTVYLSTSIDKQGQLEVAKSNGICVDSASGAMILSNCINAGTWHFRAKSPVSSGSGGSGSGSLGDCSTKGGGYQSVAAAQCDARIILAQHNESGQYSCMDNIFVRESGWRWNASNPAGGNPSTSAYGIPQSLPGSKMASAGSDWQTNPVTQIKWGLSYMNGKYGSPCAAWAYWQGPGHGTYIQNQSVPTNGSGGSGLQKE